MKTRLRLNKSANSLVALIIFFIMLAFGLLSLRDNTFDVNALICGGLLSGILIFGYSIMLVAFKGFDRLLFVAAALLISIGIIMQYRLQPDDAMKQLIAITLGLTVCIFMQWFVRFHDKMRPFIMVLMGISVLMLVLLLFLGREYGGAKNWIKFGGISVQPSEFVKVVLILALAHVFDRAGNIRSMLPALIFAVLCTGILIIEKDLGAAMLFALTTLVVFFAATGNKLITFIGACAGAGGAVVSYALFDHVKQRVAVWRDPWQHYDKSGYQIAQGLMAMASGGLFGLGLGMGSSSMIPASHTDYIFAAICEEFGVLTGICVIALYIVFIIRGLIIAINAPGRFLMIAALGCTVMITLQSFIIIGGVIKLIPLTGITLPFVSYGGSSMISCMMLFGMLQGIASLSANTERASGGQNGY